MEEENDLEAPGERERELHMQVLKIEGRISGSLEATSILRSKVMFSTTRVVDASADETKDGHR